MASAFPWGRVTDHKPVHVTGGKRMVYHYINREQIGQSSLTRGFALVASLLLVSVGLLPCGEDVDQGNAAQLRAASTPSVQVGTGALLHLTSHAYHELAAVVAQRSARELNDGQLYGVNVWDSVDARSSLRTAVFHAPRAALRRRNCLVPVSETAARNSGSCSEQPRLPP